MKKPKLIITEVFFVKADWNRTFLAHIFREKTDNGKEFIRGNVVVGKEGKIWCCADSEEKLGLFLDSMCLLKLDKGLHSDEGKKDVIAGTSFFLN